MNYYFVLCITHTINNKLGWLTSSTLHLVDKRGVAKQILQPSFLGGGGGSESMDGQGCAILALELVPKNLIVP